MGPGERFAGIYAKGVIFVEYNKNANNKQRKCGGGGFERAVALTTCHKSWRPVTPASASAKSV